MLCFQAYLYLLIISIKVTTTIAIKQSKQRIPSNITKNSELFSKYLITFLNLENLVSMSNFFIKMMAIK